MKKFLTLISLSLLIFSCTKTELPSKHTPAKVEHLRASEDFVQGSEDIPLLVGMEKISEDSLGFDSNSGSIMSSSYATKIDLEKVKNFYQKTLPQMGWRISKSDLGKSKFRRDKEKLEIDFVNQDGKDVVRFFISSAL